MLVPLDGSKTGEAALPWAKFFAEAEGTNIELLSCFRPLSAVYTYPDFATPPPVAYDLSGFIRTSEKYLKLTAQEYELPENTVTTVKEGEPAELIISHSEADDVESLLLASHGRGGIGRWLLGSVVTKVVRGCRKPVFVFPASKEEPKPPKLGRILVCLDGSKISESALTEAVKLARVHGSELTLFRSVEYFPYPASAYQLAVESEQKVCQEYLDGLAGTLSDLKVQTVVRITSAVQGILEQAEEHDLVVVASHGLGGFERWLLGSVTEKVLHLVKSPLLIVHTQETDDT